jgi:hypothetical protein
MKLSVRALFLLRTDLFYKAIIQSNHLGVND